jgi:GAF domain-containing protein
MDAAQAARLTVVRVIAGDLSPDGALQHVAQAALAMVDGTAGAVVVVAGESVDSLTVTTSPWAHSIWAAHTTARDGPATTAIATGQAVQADANDLAACWPRFWARARGLGLGATLSAPLVLSGKVLGVVALYAHTDSRFRAAEVERLEGFLVDVAPVAGAAQLVHLLARNRTHAAELHEALRVRPVIDQAIGILRSRTGESVEAAMTSLRATSNRSGVRVIELAQQIVDDAVRDARATARRA